MTNASQKRVVIVTGAAQGIAAAIAEKFAALGDRVAICDLPGRVEGTASRLREAGAEILAFDADVTRANMIKSMVDAVVARWGRIDVLVNSAGGYGQRLRPTHEMPEEEWDSVIDSNLKGTFLVSKHVIPTMLKQKAGRIINFSSIAGRTRSPILGCCYTASKAAIIGLSKHMSAEYASEGILVNTVAPGPIEGQRNDYLHDERTMGLLLAAVPIGRLGEAREIADVVVFLASLGASFMTGAILDVNGGYLPAP
jgi:NAD(P)-dependent dehydrogenase (short-subunit alcohol dehydrogenase family)